jgi:signal transduction histidine kinase
VTTRTPRRPRRGRCRRARLRRRATRSASRRSACWRAGSRTTSTTSSRRCAATPGLARDALSGPTPDVAAARDDLVEVERAVERASALVRQLLAFGRRQARAPEPLDLNRLVRDAATLLRVLVGEEVRLTLRLDPEVPPVHADRSQVEQVLMNLVLNGRDAIAEARAAGGAARPAGGALTITTEVESVAGADVRRTGVPAAGPYVRLAVRDDGAGMSDATRARIFEPFFTTKAPDRGTGLGLAAVWGIVRQSGGGIYVESEPGKGSTFSVYLPVAVPRRAPAAEAPAHAGAAPFGAAPAVPEARRTAPRRGRDRRGRRAPGRPRPRCCWRRTTTRYDGWPRASSGTRATGCSRRGTGGARSRCGARTRPRSRRSWPTCGCRSCAATTWPPRCSPRRRTFRWC